MSLYGFITSATSLKIEIQKDHTSPDGYGYEGEQISNPASKFLQLTRVYGTHDLALFILI